MRRPGVTPGRSVSDNGPPPVPRSRLDNAPDAVVSSIVERTEGPVSDERYVTALRRALEEAPVSRRELARRAGLSHATLNRIASGETETTRGGAPLDVAKALDAIARECDEAAGHVWAVKDAYKKRLELGPDHPAVRGTLEELDRKLGIREAEGE